MGNIDKTKTILLIDAKNQRAEDVFGWPENADYLVDNTENPTLQLTFDKRPKDPNTGYLFGSGTEICDVLLDTANSRGISRRVFSIQYEQKRSGSRFEFRVLTEKGVSAVGEQQEPGDAQLTELNYKTRHTLIAGETQVLLFGNIQLGLTLLERDDSEQMVFNRNLIEYVELCEKATPNIGQLNVQASNMETPHTRVFTGLWGSYTAAGWAPQGTSANITACISKTGVTCFIKEAKAVGANASRKKEIRTLRKIAHPSIVQYIDRDNHFTWVAMEFASLGTLVQQHHSVPFTPPETEVVVYQALHALNHIHGHEIVHYDIKPENILVQIRDEQRILIKVAGFGISARVLRAHIGAASYLAPECFERPPTSWDSKVDVWALAMVAMGLLFDIPPVEIVARSVNPQAQSPYAEGSHGQHKLQVDQLFEQYNRYTPDINHIFVDVLYRMFHSQPESRFSALEACENLRTRHSSGYFFVLKKTRIPHLLEPTPPAHSQSGDNSIFRFCQLDIETLSGPLLMLEGCYLVNMRQIIELITELKSDVEVSTCSMLRRYETTCWRFKRTNELPERYIRIELAVKLCSQHARLRPVVKALRDQQAKLQAMSNSPGPEGNANDSSDNEEPGLRQLGLVESIPTYSHIIGISEEGRMILVRALDGYIHVPSLDAVVARRLFSKEDVLVDEYIPLRSAVWNQRLSHDDVFSLGAATYPSY